MNTKKAPLSKSSASDGTTPRVALTLKVTKSDYLRLSKLRLKLLESGRDSSHQDILQDALEAYFHKHGV
jgi:hypothetical protein